MKKMCFKNHQYRCACAEYKKEYGENWLNYRNSHFSFGISEVRVVGSKEDERLVRSMVDF